MEFVEYVLAEELIQFCVWGCWRVRRDEWGRLKITSRFGLQNGFWVVVPFMKMQMPGKKSRDLYGHIKFEIYLRQLEQEKEVQDGCQRKG